eukprot:GHVQ01023960.1.p1 GENE.GHVQ01023960.1~~GHVQ01023960.1.p1  ORF type:complete len:660 (-),score=89.09 GHVQ01023960.1:5159-7138(-)
MTHISSTPTSSAQSAGSVESSRNPIFSISSLSRYPAMPAVLATSEYLTLPSSSFFGRTWEIFKSHKWKCIAACSATAAVIYVSRKIYLQAKELHQLLDAATSPIPDYLMHSDDESSIDTQNVNTPLTEEQRRQEDLLLQFSIGNSPQWKMVLHFYRNQHASDVTVERLIDSVAVNVLGRFNIQYFTTQLRDNHTGLTPAEKDSYFREVKLLVFGRFFVTINVIAALLLLHRLQINFIGGKTMKQRLTGPDTGGSDRKSPWWDDIWTGKADVEKDSTDSLEELSYAYLSSSQRVCSAESLDMFVEIVTGVVVRIIGDVEPQRVVDVRTFYKLMSRVQSEVNTKLFETLRTEHSTELRHTVDSSQGTSMDEEGEDTEPTAGSLRIVSLLLPESSDQSRASAHKDVGDASSMERSLQSQISLCNLNASVFDRQWLSAEGVKTVESHLDVTRDYIESPNFREVYEVTTDTFVREMVDLVMDKMLPAGLPKNSKLNIPRPVVPASYDVQSEAGADGAEMPANVENHGKATSQGEGQESNGCSVDSPDRESSADNVASGGDRSKGEFLLARTLGRVCHVSEALMFSETSCCHGFITAFANLPETRQFCEDIFFSGGLEAEEESDILRSSRGIMKCICKMKGIEETLRRLDFGAEEYGRKIRSMEH